MFCWIIQPKVALSSSTMKYLDIQDPIRKFNEVFGGKWRLLILEQLFRGTQRFTELEHSIPGISGRMLAKEIKSLTNHLVVEKTVYKELPPRVEYNLTDYGIKLLPLIEQIREIGLRHYEMENNPYVESEESHTVKHEQIKTVRTEKSKSSKVEEGEPKVKTKAKVEKPVAKKEVPAGPGIQQLSLF